MSPKEHFVNICYQIKVSVCSSHFNQTSDLTRKKNSAPSSGLKKQLMFIILFGGETSFKVCWLRRLMMDRDFGQRIRLLEAIFPLIFLSALEPVGICEHQWEMCVCMRECGIQVWSARIEP